METDREAYEADEAVSHEDEVVLVAVHVPDNRVHPAHLEIAGHDMQIRVRVVQGVALQLRLEVLHNEIDSDEIVAALPGDDHVCEAARRANVPGK